MKKKNLIKQYFIILLPVLSVTAAIIIALLLPDSRRHQTAAHPYFAFLLTGILIAYITAVIIGIFKKAQLKKITDKAPLLAAAVLFFNILNIVTVKTALLPVLYFPSLDRVIGALFEDRSLIIKCVLYSSRILITGVIGGAAAGFFMGVGIGFSKKISYWISPIIRILGPIPSTAWIPIVLIVFPTALSASAFIIGIAVWFPVTVLTSSGVSNVEKSYFEVSSTLGAKSITQIFKVGVPAAMPSIFQGLFNGICASFITLMTAEMIGAKYGIGWYVNWQKDMMVYSNVYAGLVVIAVLFYLIITVMFKLRDRVLVWQKGVIKW
ncbi:MAG: ABC transporter permease subunit [bacterium]|nr:ABC transporter permease subunit [bacterium]